MSNERYLGDAVYAEIERGMVKLTTRDGYGPNPITNTIYLELGVMIELMKYTDTYLVDPKLPPRLRLHLAEGQEMEPPVYTRLLTDEEMESLKKLDYDFGGNGDKQ